MILSSSFKNVHFEPKKKAIKSLFHLIYPSANQIRESKFGYSSGSSFPYYEKTHLKQKWLQKYFHKWSTAIGGYDRIMPHCKNWIRVSSDKNDIRLVVTGSHNLSKAAWGCEEKGGTQVHIRSYEERIVIKVNTTNLAKLDQNTRLQNTRQSTLKGIHLKAE